MKRVLVAPLNWGLGHATRCIPLIRTLDAMGVEVLLASDGAALDLLRLEFPQLRAFRLPSYKVRYKSRNMVWNMFWQLPRMIWAVRREHGVLRRLVRDHDIQGVLSDNRYGCFATTVDSVLITHQLQLRVPGRVLAWLVNAVLKLALRKFDRIWVPDADSSDNLTGALSHGADAHPKISFAGIFTRMQAYPKEQEYDVAVVLSGPEPQRSILEGQLLEQAVALPQRFIFVQGKTQMRKHYFASDNVEVVSYLTSKELNEVLAASSVLVCRSGYSSIMDLAALGKKALLIPTPGQTEQEYLAERFAERGIFAVQSQEKMDLAKGLKQVAGTAGITPGAFPVDAFEGVLTEWLKQLPG